MRLAPLLAVSLLSLLAVLPAASAGSPQEPEVTDPVGDADPAGALDITAAWIDGAEPLNVTFHLLVPKLPALQADAGGCGAPGCAAATLSLKLEFEVRRPDGAPAPALPGYNRTFAVYRHGGPAGVRAAVGYIGAAGALTFTGNASASVAEGGEVVVRVPRADPSIAIPAGPAPGRYGIVALVVHSSPQACSPAAPADTAGASPLGAPCSTPAQPTTTSGTPPVGTTS
ncbi:MAG TPA: hypothetical protein VHI93_07035, partial [Candidatus Thermoplasmatota archaeon]|nr:hypothetical protein [Candidatus Thermoplasmatota archaeon]